MNNIKAHFAAALFDMDGLLLDTESIVVGCLEKTAQRYGFEDLQSTFLSMVGLRFEDSQQVLQAGLGERMQATDFHHEAADLVKQRLQQPVPVKSTVVELLQRLEAENIPCAVASSTRTAQVEHHLLAAGLRKYFATITGGDQVSKGKPDPEIYLTAAATLNVSAKDCVVFEDSEPGTLAGLASGATVVQVPDLKQPSQALIERGHVIATSVLDGALAVKLV